MKNTIGSYHQIRWRSKTETYRNRVTQRKEEYEYPKGVPKMHSTYMRSVLDPDRVIRYSLP